MLVFEPKEPNLMDRPPRNPKEQILPFPLVMRTGLVTVVTVLGGFGLFYWELNQEQSSVLRKQQAICRKKQE